MQRASPRWLAGYRSWKYGFLLACLVSLFLLEPFLGSDPYTRGLVEVVFGLTLLVAALAPAHTPRSLAVALVVGIPAVLLVSHPDSPHWLRVTDSACHVALLIFAVVMILVDVLRPERVTLDKVFGALCGYLLVGLLYAVGYGLLGVFEPGSFSGTTGRRDFPALVYFSLITLCTVGYGDVLPLTEKARALSALEAVTGQFYLTVLVGRLVALQIVHQEDLPE